MTATRKTNPFILATILALLSLHAIQESNNIIAMSIYPLPPNSPMTQSTGDPVGDPSWGFRFISPEGWNYQLSPDGAILGHTSIPGIILIYPHLLNTMDEVQQQMNMGIQEEGSYLSLSGSVSATGNQLLEADYEGIVDGAIAKGHGLGTLSPHGGGAFIVAISTPEMFGEEILRDARWIANHLVYKKIETTQLVQHFSGRWANFTTNTSTWIEFRPDGTYNEQYESSYSGDLSGGGNWNAYGGDNAMGRWIVQGNMDQGRITVQLSDGREVYYDYRVHEENGQKYYGEYWFNGKLYGKSGN